LPEQGTIGRVAVLGAGTMGSRIAATLAGAGNSVLLMDLSEQLAREGIARAEAGPAVTPSSFDFGIPQLQQHDWVLEAVSENLAVKRSLWARVAPALNSSAIASTNTSGISIAAIADGLPLAFQQQFLGLHFFNPPAKLRLVELIRHCATLPQVAARAAGFLTNRLDRVVVEAKDTPNFIANRIGAYFSGAAQHLAMAGNYTVEEIDALTGPLIGLPKSGVYRLIDVVGLDVWAQVMIAPQQPYFTEMLRRNLLGEKTGGGFYRKVMLGGQKCFEVLNLNTLQYHSAVSYQPEGSAILDLSARLRYLLAQNNRNANFLRPLLTGLFSHCHRIAPEIAYSNEDIDRAMHFGYGWTLGPFALEAAIA